MKIIIITEIRLFRVTTNISKHVNPISGPKILFRNTLIHSDKLISARDVKL